MTGFDVVRAGRRPEESADFRLVDLADEPSVSAACSDADLVVTTVRHPRHVAERVVLRDGGLLLSVASLTASDRAELKGDGATGPGLVVVHAGLLPGVGSLVFKHLLAEHPDADGLEVSACFSMVQSSGAAGTVDFAYPALTSARRHPTRVVEFPKSIGRRRCMHVGGSEIGSFGELADGRTGRVYFTVRQRVAQRSSSRSTRCSIAGRASRRPRAWPEPKSSSPSTTCAPDSLQVVQA